MKASVIIPSIGRPTLQAAQASVAAQTMADYEVLVDTGPGGPWTARNRAAARAKGEWLAFLDDDETWLPEYLETVTAADADFTLTRYVGQGGAMLTDESLLKLMSSGCSPVAGSGLAVRRAVFGAVGGFAEDVGPQEIYDLVLRLFFAGYRYAHLSRPLYRRCLTRADHVGNSVSGDERRAMRKAIYARTALTSGADVARRVVTPSFSHG